MPALLNSLAQLIPIAFVLFFVFLIALVIKGVPMDSQAWQVLAAIFAGAVAFVSLGMSLSALADWYVVEPTGLAYRVSHGVGNAQLIIKKTYKTKWEDILTVTASRYLPFKCLSVKVRREEGRDLGDSFTLPLYLREQKVFVQAVLSNAPDDHPIRAVLEPETSTFSSVSW